MNKGELVDRVAAEIEGVTKSKVDEVLTRAIAVIQDAVAGGDTVLLAGFGSWKAVERAERVGRNPKTGDQMTIPAQRAVKFSVGNQFKEAVKDGQS